MIRRQQCQEKYREEWIAENEKILGRRHLAEEGKIRIFQHQQCPAPFKEYFHVLVANIN